jgi:hypothetical protein
VHTRGDAGNGAQQPLPDRTRAPLPPPARRGAIIPASFPDWRGVLLSGAVFGLLHNSGGRNPAFAAWAGAVGCLYGGLFVVSHNIWVPATAHVAANFASAAVWKAKNQGSGGDNDA